MICTCTKSKHVDYQMRQFNKLNPLCDKHGCISKVHRDYIKRHTDKDILKEGNLYKLLRLKKEFCSTFNTVQKYKSTIRFKRHIKLILNL